jgi:hypothetical protein
MIISESTERYDAIRNFIMSLKLHIIKDDYDNSSNTTIKRWFTMHIINNTYDESDDDEKVIIKPKKKV